MTGPFDLFDENDIPDEVLWELSNEMDEDNIPGGYNDYMSERGRGGMPIDKEDIPWEVDDQ